MQYEIFSRSKLNASIIEVGEYFDSFLNTQLNII